MSKKYIKTFESYVSGLQDDSLNEEFVNEAKGPSKDFGFGAKSLKDLKVGDLVWREMERHNPQLGVYYTLDKVKVGKITGKKIWVEQYGRIGDSAYDREAGFEVNHSEASYGSAYYSLLTHQEVLGRIKAKPKKYRNVQQVKAITFENIESILNEGNAFVYARQEAIDNDEDEFKFNGKTYPVSGNKKGGKSLKESETELNEAEKIACLECDEVNTKAAWKKNNGVCPSCNASTQGVKESISEAKVNEGNGFIAAKRKAVEEGEEEFEFEGKTYKVTKKTNESAVSELMVINENLKMSKGDVDYWMGYYTDEFSSKNELVKREDFERGVTAGIKDWNFEAERGSKVTKGEEKIIRPLARQFFNSTGWISSTIVQAMIAQSF